jgi:hypothetical protein
MKTLSGLQSIKLESEISNVRSRPLVGLPASKPEEALWGRCAVKGERASALEFSQCNSEILFRIGVDQS